MYIDLKSSKRAFEIDLEKFYQARPMQLGGLHTIFCAVRALWKVNGELVYEGAADWIGLKDVLDKMKSNKTGFNKLNIEFFILIQQAWICELIEYIKINPNPEFESMCSLLSVEEYFEKYCEKFKSLKLFHRALFTDINVLLDLWHARELRGRDAQHLYHSGLKKFLRLTVVGGCHQYVKNVLYELRQLFDMSVDVRQYYLNNVTCVHRECKNKAGGKSTFFSDEYLEMYLIQVSKELIDDSADYQTVLETGEQLNVLTGIKKTLKVMFKGEDDELAERGHSNALKQSYRRLCLLRAVFRVEIFLKKVTTLN